MTYRILVVDDTQTVRSFQTMILKSDEYEVTEASDGLEALKKIQESPPDLVLLDIEMPRMNGIDCCQKIKNSVSEKDIKVIMVTTLSEYSKIREAFKVGADDYITKPVDPTELRTKVKELLKFIELKKLIRS